MADPFTLLFLATSRNFERERWTTVQRAWEAAGKSLGLTVELAGDTWPATRRSLGTRGAVTMTIGITGHRQTWLEAEDPAPLDGLRCDVAPARFFSLHKIFSGFESGDSAFDRDFAVQANDPRLALALLDEPLRTAFRAAPPRRHFRYAEGRARVAWRAAALDRADLSASLTIVLAACRRTTGIYR
jgi:hypothetical protein